MDAIPGFFEINTAISSRFFLLVEWKPCIGGIASLLINYKVDDLQVSLWMCEMQINAPRIPQPEQNNYKFSRKEIRFSSVSRSSFFLSLDLATVMLLMD